MGRRLHRVATVVLAVVVTAGSLAPCAGWLTTPDARMACCTDDATCPMHKDGADATGRPMSQAAADACCALPAGDDATPTVAYTAYTLSAMLDLGSVTSFAWHAAIRPLASSRVDQPPPPRAIARHLLLSVLLV